MLQTLYVLRSMCALRDQCTATQCMLYCNPRNLLCQHTPTTGVRDAEKRALLTSAAALPVGSPELEAARLGVRMGQQSWLSLVLQGQNTR